MAAPGMAAARSWWWRGRRDDDGGGEWQRMDLVGAVDEQDHTTTKLRKGTHDEQDNDELDFN